MCELCHGAGILGHCQFSETSRLPSAGEPTLSLQDRGQTQSTLRNKASFLNLPAEIRFMIYRLLLLFKEQVYYELLVGLSPQILCTCRQVLNEALPILYRENEWKVIMRERYGMGLAHFPDTNHLADDPPEVFTSRYLEMIRFYLIVEIQDVDQVPAVRSSFTRVCKLLSSLPDLHLVRVKLTQHGLYGGECPQHCQVLENVTLLRNVRNVIFEGVPHEYAKYLTNKMTGSAPLDHLPLMYDSLVSFAGGIDFCFHDLQVACETMETSNVKAFKEIRSKIVEAVSKHMTNALEHLYDHDAQV